MNKKRPLLCALLLAPAAQQAIAADPATPVPGISPIIEIGLYFGKEELATRTFVPGTSDDIDVGGLIDFNLGAVKSFSPRHELQATLGFRFAGTNGERGDVSWSRWVIEGKYFYRLDGYRLGLGLTYHLGPSFEINLNGHPSRTVDFDAALGVVAEWNHLSRDTYWGIKYTVMDYTAGDLTIEGNSLGIVYGFNFR